MKTKVVTEEIPRVVVLIAKRHAGPWFAQMTHSNPSSGVVSPPIQLYTNKK